MNVFQKYAHVFWIPMFPTGKTGGSQCSNCGQVLKYNYMPDALRASYERVKDNAGTPIWAYSGLGAIVLIIAAVAINDGKKTEATADYVLHPKKGDVVQIKLDSVYTLIKLTNVDRDSVYFVTNQFQTTDDTEIDDLTAKPYDTEVISMSLTKLAELNKEGKIINIDR